MLPIPKPDQAELPSDAGEGVARERRVFQGDRVPYSGYWKPSCDEAKRHLTAGAHFPKCIHHDGRTHSWTCLDRD
jgi:hypothetical protein